MKQTEELFKYGRVTSGGGRGKAFVDGTLGKLNSLFKVKSGTAYARGSYVTNGAFHSNNKFYTNYRSKVDKKKDEFLETVDWIEIMIDRIERAIQRLDTVANSAYVAFSRRNHTLVQEFGKVKEEIALQEAAARAYADAANRVGLEWSYVQKVQNGTLQIESISDEKLATKIKEYQDLYSNMQRYLAISN